MSAQPPAADSAATASKQMTLRPQTEPQPQSAACFRRQQAQMGVTHQKRRRWRPWAGDVSSPYYVAPPVAPKAPKVPPAPTGAGTDASTDRRLLTNRHQFVTCQRLHWSARRGRCPGDAAGANKTNNANFIGYALPAADGRTVADWFRRA
jgi:hypothetical protein